MNLSFPTIPAHQPPRPIPACYWVHAGRLLAGEYPGALDVAEARQKLCHFLDAGVTAFLDLTEEGELEPYAPLLHDAAQQRGIAVQHARHPIPDGTCPSRAYMEQILDAISTALQHTRTLYVHCWGGTGRTGTVIGCLLVRYGMHSTTALDTLKQLMQTTTKSHRPSPETAAQRAMVRHWAASAPPHHPTPAPNEETRHAP